MMQTLKKYLDAKWEISMKGHIVHHQLSLPLESNNLVPRLLSRALVEKGAAKLIRERDYTHQKLFLELNEIILDEKKREFMGIKAKESAFPKAAETIKRTLFN